MDKLVFIGVYLPHKRNSEGNSSDAYMQLKQLPKLKEQLNGNNMKVNK